MEVSESAARAVAEVRRQQTRCPWNPFPADSDWGRKLDQMYRKSEATP